MQLTDATTMTSRRVEQPGGRRVAKTIDLVVDRRVLLDVGVARRDVGLGLVVVVVADEVLDPVVREELAHLLGQLGGEALVGGEDQCRTLHLLDRPRDGRRLAGTGDAEQRLEAIAALDALGQLGDRGRLITGRLEVGHDPEGLVAGGQIGHRTSLPANGRSVKEASATPDPSESTSRRWPRRVLNAAVRPRSFLPFTTERLTVRAMRPSDVTTFTTYRNLPEVARYQDWELPYTRDLAHQLIDEMDGLNGPRPGEWVQLAIDDIDGTFVGDLAVYIDTDIRTAMIGYSMHPAYQGRGYATEAAGALIDRLFDRLHVHRVAATLDPENVASARVLERLGFRYEGRALKAAYVRGEWADDDRYAILVDERLAWRERTQGNAVDGAARRDHSRQRLRGRTAGHPPLAATVRRHDAGVVHRRPRARDHRRPSGRAVDARDRGRR